jgi:integrase
MSTIKIALDRRYTKKDGTYPIIIQTRSLRIATPYSALPENWDGIQFNRKEPNHIRKNALLREMLAQAERVLIELDEARRYVPDKKLAELIKDAIGSSKRKKDAKVFLDYLDDFIATKTKPGTRTVYQTTRNKLAQYDPACTFDTMDRAWLARFDAAMASSGMKVNSRGIHLRNIRAVFNYAIDEEKTTAYPFRKFTIRKEETRKRSLSVEELRTLRDYPCEEYQARYRDMFMLMFYLIGINAADLFLARPRDVVHGRLEYKRAKTGKLYSVLLQPEALEIIERYRGKDYLLNVMDEYKDYRNFLHRMGIALKEIGPVQRVGRGGLKVREPLFPELSSYWSRHTWATIAAGLDVPKETISEALGHSIGSEVTAIYIRFDQKKVDAANRLVIDHVNGGL